MLQVRFLGQFDVRADGKRVLIPSRSGQSLFAFLVLNARAEHRREKLAGILWPDVADDLARKNLRQELWRIRKAITTQSPPDGDALVADEYLISFQPGAHFWFDVEQLEHASRETLSDRVEMLDELLNAVTLYRGELLPGFYDEWIILERDRVQAVFEARIGLVLDELTRALRWKQAQDWAERWIALGQTPEPAYRALMMAAAAQGDSAKLALAYERCVEAMQKDLGVEPSAKTRALFQELSHAEPTPAPTLKPLSPVLIQPSGTVTFLFTDIEGSTQLLERLGSEYANLLADQRDLLRATAEKHHGYEVDTQGDAFFFAFFRAADAVSFAAAAQHNLANHTWPQGERLRVRMGLHTGEPMLARTGYVGMDVHRAARIGASGHGGQVLLSRTTSALVENELPDGTHLNDLGEHRLKDLRYPVHIIQLTIDGLPSDFPPIKTSDTAAEPPAPGAPPFKGLEFFDERDADLFFGREQLVEKLLSTIHAQNFLAVVIGASGSGKSSIVRAGLIPALKTTTDDRQSKDNGWRVYVMTPTAHPLEALATTLTRDSETVTATATLFDDLARDPRSLQLFLRRMSNEEERWSGTRLETKDERRKTNDSSFRAPPPTSHVLLVVDQFEELFTLCRDDFEREQFIDCLLDAITVSSGTGGTRSQLLTLVITLRADFYSHLAQYPELRDAVSKQQEYIGPMNVEELRRTMEEPAARSGWVFEPGLVDLILRDVGEEPGALPLLSHALLETWKRRSGHTMTLKGYADSGGVRGAIAHTAETTYQQFSPEQQAIARSIFLRLTELGEGTEDTRRRAEFGELETGDWERNQVRNVLSLLADARLITTGQHTAEVAHEALIREWPRLREWLSEDREGLKLHRNLTEAAHEWEMMERDASMLYRGARLALAQEFAASANALNAGERAFLEASEENEKREEREREAQRERELLAAQKLGAEQQARAEESSRANRRLRRRAVFLAGVVVLALLAAGAAFFFLTQSNANLQAANEQRTEADAQRDNAQKAQAEAEKEKRAATARELAAASVANLDVDPERGILLALEAVGATRKQDGSVLREAEEALHRAVQTSRIVRTFSGMENPNQVVYSPDATRLAVRAKTGLKIFDVETGSELISIPLGSDHSDHVAFNLDGKELITLDFPDEEKTLLKIFDSQTGATRRSLQLPIPLKLHTSSAYSADWKHVVVGQTDGIARVFEMETGKELVTLKGHTDAVNDVAFSPDGTRIATASNDKTAKIWDASTGRELLTLRGHVNPLLKIVFSKDGRFVASGAQDQTARVWDAATGAELQTFADTTWTNALAFSPDGTRLGTAGGTGFAKLWDATNGKQLDTFAGHVTSLTDITFSPDSEHLATTSIDGTVRIWIITPNREVLTVATGGVSDPLVGEANAAYSPDGKYLAVGLTNGTIPVLDAQSGKKVMTLTGHTGSVHKIAFSPDGTRLASASNDKTAKIWDLATGKDAVTLRGHNDVVIAVGWSPDGTRLVTGSQDKTVKIWDARTTQELKTLSEGDGAFYAIAYSPTSKYLAASNIEDYQTFVGQLFVWDTETSKLVYSQHVPFIDHLVFSPDGSQLTVATGDAPKVLDAATGKTLVTLKGPGGPFWIAYDLDGKRIATANPGGIAIIYDAASGESLLTLNVGNVDVRGVSFSPDGTRLATADDEAVRVFLLNLDDLVALAKTRITRSLTQEECQKYLHVEKCP